MDINSLISYLQELQKADKGDYKALAHNVNYNSASGGYYNVHENAILDISNIKIYHYSNRMIM